MTADAKELLARTTLVIRRGPFTLAAWDTARAGDVLRSLADAGVSHAYTVLDDREVTLFAPESALAAGFPPPERREDGWCLLTLDTVMAWDVVGILAAVSGALAGAGVPIGAVAAYGRDHLLVASEHLDRTVAALEPTFGGVRTLD